jgi:two-component system OmpR family sensor kinase
MVGEVSQANAPSRRVDYIDARFAWTRSLRFRLTLSFSSALACVMIIVAVVLYTIVARGILAETDSFLGLESHRLTAAVAEKETSNEPSELAEALSVDRSVTLRSQRFPGVLVFELVYARIVDAQSKAVLAQSPSLTGKHDLSTSLDQWRPGGKVRFAFVGPDDERMMRVISEPIAFGTRPAFLQVAVPWDSNEDTVEHAGAFLAVCVAVVLVIAVAGCWVLVGRTLQPIQQIVTEAERVDAETLAEGLLAPPAATDSEVGHLVDTLNRMTVRLHRAFEAQRRYAEAQRQFAADASHELRTPLTIMRGEVEYALMRPRDEDTYRKTLEAVVADVEHLSSIVESLTLLARLDTGKIGGRDKSHPVDLAALASAVVEDVRPIAVDKGLNLTFSSTNATALVDGDEEQIRLVVRNLVDNALKYTPSGGSVMIAIADVDEAGGRTVRELSVRDTGIGISEEDLPHIFERFWRADRARTAPGTGLGLAIAAQIVAAYGGTLTAESRLGAWSNFMLTLPASRQHMD